MNTVSTDSKAIERFVSRSVEHIYPTPEKLSEILKSGKRISVYLGIDPTGPSLHVGHAIAIRKLAELQQLGHKVILLIGDFTAMIGDPTDKLATRKPLTREEVLANCKTYKEQASLMLKFDGENPAELKFNSEWLAKMSFSDVVELASHFTVQQMLERDMFEKRIHWKTVCPFCEYLNLLTDNSIIKQIREKRTNLKDGGIKAGDFARFVDVECERCGKEYKMIDGGEFSAPKPVGLHEFLYPLMQGYDSVAMDVDLEIGGNDQTFNMLAGRTLMREVKQKEKFVLTCKLLADATGKKMGKTEGNMITLGDAPEDMYGKVMSWTDGMILPGFELCTNVSSDDIAQIASQMNAGENPMTFKKQLAQEVVATFISSAAAEQAAAHFVQVHQKGEVPEEVAEWKLGASAKLVDVLVESGLVSSKTDARRQIEQGGVRVNDSVMTDVAGEVKVGDVIQKGKRHFVKLV